MYSTEAFKRLAEDKRRRIVDAAAGEFALHGFSAANINTIAARAGVSVGSLYKYFTSKELCFLAVLDAGLRDLEEALGNIMISDQTPLAKIESILRLIPEHSRRKTSIVRLYHELGRERVTDVISDFCIRFEGLSARFYQQMMHTAALEGLLSPAIDVRIFSFLMDSIFVSLQFTYACEYHMLRKQVYIGADRDTDDELLITQALLFIRNAMGTPPAA